MGRTKHYKSISRIDQPEKHTHGWYVRVRYGKKQLTKFFNDKQNGGKVKALSAAVRYRDASEKKLGKPRTDRFVVGRLANQRDSVGVRLVIKTSRTVSGEIRESPAYEVTWSPEPNVVQRTSISIRKHGKREALRMARELRRSKEKQYYGLVR